MYLGKDIVKEGNALLKQISKEVNLPISSVDLEILKNLYEYVVVSSIDSLVEQYNIRPGVGIAAPQVGHLKRMFAINFTDFMDDDNTRYSMAVINPKIIRRSKEMVYLPGGEGCLSVDRDTKDNITPRHKEITFKAHIYDFNNNSIKVVTKTLKGYPAIVFQHEYDHLDGILFTDKMYKTLDAKPLYEFEEDEEE